MQDEYEDEFDDTYGAEYRRQKFDVNYEETLQNNDDDEIDE